MPEYIDGSLLITPELCSTVRYCCREGLDFMKRFHPNGFTVRQVKNKEVRHVPMEFVCWGYHFLPFSEQDKADWIEYTQVVNSTDFYESHHIKDCSLMESSSHCENSINVVHSTDIIDSSRISFCTDVHESENIHTCETVYESKNCNHSQKVMSSSCVFRSKDIHNSHAIDKCEKINNSLFLRNCNNMRSAILCVDMSDCDRRILCNAECNSEYEYAILNHEVSEAVFVRIYRQLKELLLDIPYLYGSNKKKDVDFSHYVPSMSAWVATLTGYWVEILDILPSISDEDRKLAYSITFLPEIIK